MARSLAAVFVLLAGAALFVLFWPQLFGLQRAPFVAQLVSLRAAAALAALASALVLTVLALLFARARRFFGALALVLILFVAGTTAVLADRGFGAGGFEVAGERDVTVLAWNTLGDAVPVDTIAETVVQNGADVVSLPETTRETAEAVAERAREAGLPLRAHTVSYGEVAKARSTSLLISEDLGPYVISDDGVTEVLPSVVAYSTDGGPTLVAVHAVAPLPSEIESWQNDLAALASLCGEPEVIMAGDFNATLDAFAGLGLPIDGVDGVSGGDLGQCLDAASRAGAAAVGTWPSSAPALLGPAIDHVLATPGWRVSGFRVIGDRDGAGSDHRPVLAQLSPRS